MKYKGKAREKEILEVMASEPSESNEWTAMGIVPKIYTGTPKNLWDYAAWNVGLHLGKLEKDGKVKRVSGTGEGWVLTSHL